MDQTILYDEENPCVILDATKNHTLVVTHTSTAPQPTPGVNFTDDTCTRAQIVTFLYRAQA